MNTTFSSGQAAKKAAAAKFSLFWSENVSSWSAPVAVLITTLLTYWTTRYFNLYFANAGNYPILPVVVTFCTAIALARLRYSLISGAVRVLLRGIAAAVLIQVMFDAFGGVSGTPNVLFGRTEDIYFCRYCQLLAVVSGILGLFRPSFTLPLFLFYEIFRVRIGKDTGIPVVATDYRSMLDIGCFCVIGTIVTISVTGQKFERFRGWIQISNGDLAIVRERSFTLVWSWAVGAHLGNYFYSGIAKLGADRDNPLTWLLHNKTEISILNGLERGDNPLAQWPSAVDAVWAAIGHAGPYLNSVVLATQLLAVLAILNRRTLRCLTVFYDLFHLGVYLTLGALFHYWILVNVLIFVSAKYITSQAYSLPLKITMLISLVFGRYLFFYTNDLGWLDGAKLASARIFAVTRDDRLVQIPGPYFGIFSYNLAQGWVYLPDDSFPFRIAGNTSSFADWQDAARCGPITVPHQDTGITLMAIENMIRRADAVMRTYPKIKELNLYYYYPHHMVPNPFVFQEFNQLSMNEIVGYRYEVDSVCLDLQNGKLIRNVRRSWHHSIDLP